MAGCYPPPAVPIISTSSKPSQDTGSGYCTFFSSAVQRSSDLDRAPPCRNACAKERGPAGIRITRVCSVRCMKAKSTSIGFTMSADLEAASSEQHAFLMNETVHSFSWKGVSVTVKDRETKKPKAILENSNGHANPGEVVVLMGPSGSGKTTLLNVLAHRDSAPGAEIEGEILVNGRKIDLETFRNISSYVEQEDILVGALTVEETLYFCAQLSLPSSVPKKERLERISTLLNAFGIQNQAKTLIGTPIRKGISGGQKRRVSVASQLITCPKIIFLDEPTSGLDSTASFEVMSFVQKLAKKNKIIVIASIHQPSTATFKTFDKLMILSAGRTCYFGSSSEMKPYLDKTGYPMPLQMNPAEFVLDLVNTDFASDREIAEAQLSQIFANWEKSDEASELDKEIQKAVNTAEKYEIPSTSLRGASAVGTIFTLLHRSFIKSYRDVIAYGVRIIMYLVFITILFAVVSFWLVNYHNTATGFFTFVMWLFLDLLAAESLVVLISALFPNFVIALALTAFTNGLWMCVGGFMVSPTVLNVFWRYVFHYIDYQAYVFQGMMVNEFAERTFNCGPGCQCMYGSELESQCKIAGTGVLSSYGYATGRTGKWLKNLKHTRTTQIKKLIRGTSLSATSNWSKTEQSTQQG
ncbi:ABC transporter [Histoplasma capsulatum G186AR]|uniref:ABC transporter n=1 Tax=Ajellomyces capsulatus (strain G186AR / H82 / ATCC MYA-2454 / RMSCC 2432) TaxID=447093 RepID=C0NB71_AJECG|nr:ABC transporter [Histoplasma capsulatum G186AR]EEH10912.1 ABC transporter [Histoplasma capsulatum G186AR]